MEFESPIDETLDLVALRFPTPIADAVHRLSAWENPNQRRDRVVEAFRSVLILHTSIAMAARHHVPVDALDPPETARLFGRLRSGHLTDGDWFQFLKCLLRPWAEQPDCHPTPELVRAFFGPHAARRRSEETVNRLLGMRRRETVAHGSTGTEAEATAIAAERQADLAELLSTLMPLWERLRLVYPLARPESLEENQAAWVLRGVTHQDGRWPRASLAPGVRLVESEASLVDVSSRPVLRLHPVVLVRKPSGDRPEQVYALDGDDRARGARYVAVPSGHVWHQGDVWRELGATFDPATPEAPGNKPPVDAPFPGLRSFAQRDAPLFFGRRSLTARVVDLLERKAIVVVAGPSGAGKSSLIHAGVVPAAGRRVVISMRPGHSPMESLRASLGAVVPDAGGDVDEVRDSLLRAASVQRTDGVLLVVDQAEELFTLAGEDDEARKLLRFLASLAGSADVPLRVLVGVREDYLGRLRRLEGLDGDHVGQVLVGAMGPETLPYALTAPLSAFGFAFEDPAIPCEMAAACTEPGALPLLQFAASRLWDARDEQRRLLTRASYDAVGGVHGALSSYADSVVESLSPAQKAAARRVLVRLVTRDGARDVVSLAELGALPGSRGDVDFIVNQLAAARLLTRREGPDGSPVVELSHEALIAHWPRLRSWLSEDLERSLTLRRIRDAALHWESAGRPPDLLLQEGRPLAEARELRTVLGSSDARATRFVTASLRRARGRRLARVTLGVALIAVLTAASWLGTTAWREYARAEGATREQRKATDLARAADEARQRTERQARAQQNLARSVELVGTEPSVALRLALDTVADEPSAAAAGAVREAFHSSRELCRLPLVDGAVGEGSFGRDGDTFVLPGRRGARLFGIDCVERRRLGTGRVDAAAFDPAGRWVAVAGPSGVELWRPDGSASRKVSSHSASRILFDVGGLRLAASGGDETRVWSSDGSPVFGATGDAVRFTPLGLLVGEYGGRVLDDQGQPVTELGPDPLGVFAFDGDVVATWPGAGGTGRVSRADGELLATLEGGAVTAAALVAGWGWPDRTRIVLGTPGGAIRIVDAAGKVIQDEPAHEDTVTSLVRSGDLLASASRDGKVRLWWLQVGIQRRRPMRPLAVLNRGRGEVTGVVIQQHERFVLTSAEDHTARLWAVAREEAPTLDVDLVSAGGATATDVAVTSVRVVGLDGAARLEETVPFDLFEGRVLAGGGVVTTGHAVGSPGRGGVLVRQDGTTLELPDPADVSRCAVPSPSGQTIATCGSDGVVRLWGPDGALRRELRGNTSDVYEAAFTPDGTRLATGCRDGRIRLWTSEGELLSDTQGHDDYVVAMAWSPDGETLVTTGADATIRVWDGAGDAVATIGGLKKDAWGPLVFSPDGTLFTTTSEDHDATVWSIRGRAMATLLGHTGYVRAISFSQDGRQIATSSWDGTSRLWSARGTSLRTMENTPLAAFTSRGLLTVREDADGVATMDLAGQQPVALGRGLEDLSVDGDSLVALGHVTRVDIARPGVDAPASVDLPCRSSLIVALSPPARHVFVRSSCSRAQEFVSEIVAVEGGARWKLDAGGDGWPTVTFSPDGRLLLAETGGYDDRRATLWTADGGRVATHEGMVWSRAFSPRSDRLAMGVDKSVLVVGADGATIQTLTHGGEPVHALAWSPDGATILGGTRSGAIAIWSEDGAVTTLPASSVQIEHVAFSPSGDTFAAVDEGGGLMLWRTDGRPLGSVAAHEGAVLDLAFSPSGDFVVTAGEDGALRAFALDGSSLWTVRDDIAWVRQVEFTPDRKWLLARGDKWRRLYLRDDELLEAVRSQPTLPLTRAQARLLER